MSLPNPLYGAVALKVAPVALPVITLGVVGLMLGYLLITVTRKEGEKMQAKGEVPEGSYFG